MAATPRNTPEHISDPQELYKRVLSLKEDHLEEAFALLETNTAAFENSARLWAEYGDVCFRMMKVDFTNQNSFDAFRHAAIAALELSLSYDPELTQAYAYSAALHGYLAENLEIVEYFYEELAYRQLCLLSPQQIYDLADAYFRFGYFTESYERAKDAARMASDERWYDKKVLKDAVDLMSECH